MDRLSQIVFIYFLCLIVSCLESVITMSTPKKVSNVTQMMSSLSNSMLCLACLYVLLIAR